MQRRILLALTTLVLLAAGLGAAAWSDVVPGGRALRSLVLSADDFAAWERARHAAARLASFRAERPPRDAVVFLGSDLVESFPLADGFPEKRAVNRGIAGDTARDVLARLDDTLAGLDPAAFVVHVGDVDIRRDGRVTGPVRDDLLALLDALDARHEGVPITVLGCFAAQDADEAEVYEIGVYNIAARRAAVLRKAAFVALARAPLADEEGRLNATFATADGGVNDSGYAEVSAYVLHKGGIAGELLAP